MGVGERGSVWRLTAGALAFGLLACACGQLSPSPTATGAGGTTATPAASRAASTLSDLALLAPVPAGDTLYAYNGYDDVPAGESCPKPGANRLDHCANQLDGLDLVPSNPNDLRILSPVAGTVYYEAGGCLFIKTLDTLDLSVCHFWTPHFVAQGTRVQRGTVLGLRDPADWWIHLSLDARFDATGAQLPTPNPPGYWRPVPFASPHTLEGRSMPAATPPVHQQWACTTFISTNRPKGDFATPSPLPVIAAAPPTRCRAAGTLPSPALKGRFVPTGPMGDTPAGPVTVLPSGEVVVFFSHLAQGPSGPIVSSTSAELYDPQTGRFVPAGHLVVPRQGESATALPNGSVLVAGGSSDAQVRSPLASAELFNPRTGTSMATGSMSVARADAVATLLSDGRVLVAGGFQAVPYNGSCCIGESLASAEIFDPRTGAFAPTGSMLEPRDHGTGVILSGGRALILGGERWVPQGFSDLATAEVFDPATGQFSATGSLAVARHRPAVARLRDGRVLVAGGASFVAAGSNTLTLEPLASAEVYDPAAGTFVATGSMVFGRWEAAATALGNGTVLITGGVDHNGDGPALASAELYNPASGTFSRTGDMSTGRAGAVAVPLPNGSALVLGGVPASLGQDLSSAEVFR